MPLDSRILYEQYNCIMSAGIIVKLSDFELFGENVDCVNMYIPFAHA